MSDSEAFTLVTSSSHQKLYDDYGELQSAHLADPATFITTALRRQYPELCLTITSAPAINLLAFAATGNATAELDTRTDFIERIRGYYAGSSRSGIPEQLFEARKFAKYHYRWGSEDFIVYMVAAGYTYNNYILKEPAVGETTMSNCKVIDALIVSVGRWQYPKGDTDFIYVYDGYCNMSL